MILPPPPRAILFDLDGTLLDSAPDLAASANAMRLARGMPALPYELLRPQASKGARGLLGVAFGLQPGDAEFDALRVEFLDRYEATMTDSSYLFDGVAAMLEELAKRGIAWGIVTNKIARFSEPLVPAVGLGAAGCIISGDSTPHSKPHPAPLLAAAQALGLPAQACWYVGDDERDIAAGRAANMRSLAVGWGYGEAIDIPQWGADHIVQQAQELLGLLNTYHKM